MKSQARLRLRQAGRHCAHRRSDVDWIWRLGLARIMSYAFEYNCAPKHSTEKHRLPYNTMDYLTGKTTWHGNAHLQGAEDAARYRWKPTPLPPVHTGAEGMSLLMDTAAKVLFGTKESESETP